MVEVNLKNAANVYLVDSNNYQKLRRGKRYKYYGDYYTKTPVKISVQGYGKWYLIVEGSNYNYKFY